MFVMTNIDSGYDALDTEMVLLALATGTLIENYDAWAGQFRPRFKHQGRAKGEGKDIDRRDVGALGYALGEGKRVDTRDDSFSTMFQEFMRSAFRTRVVYAIDIAEDGGNSWEFDVFRAAASGNAKAVEAIIRHADNLTGNNFSPIFKGMNGGKVIDALGMRVPNGYYVASTGERRDIRDGDMLAAMSVFGQSSPKTVMEFADTYSPAKGTPNLRLHQRLAITEEILDSRLVITGMSQRYVFNPVFMAALVQACSTAGLTVQPANIATAGLSGGSIMGGFDIGQYASTGGNGQMFGTRAAGAPGNAMPGDGRNSWT
jgi:hypothetical protein